MPTPACGGGRTFGGKHAYATPAVGSGTSMSVMMSQFTGRQCKCISIVLSGRCTLSLTPLQSVEAENGINTIGDRTLKRSDNNITNASAAPPHPARAPRQPDTPPEPAANAIATAWVQAAPRASQAPVAASRPPASPAQPPLPPPPPRATPHAPQRPPQRCHGSTRQPPEPPPPPPAAP